MGTSVGHGSLASEEGEEVTASLVLICHSAVLADGLKELVQQVTQGKVQVLATGGLDRHTLGSNPDAILATLDAGYNPDGTLVLMDLGSSVMVTEMVLSELPPDRRSTVLLCAAPLVEGAVAAAAQLAAGASLQEAAEQADNALHPKAVQLGLVSSLPAAQPPTAAPDAQAMLTIRHEMGLHARPAALFVQTAKRFQSRIRVRHGEREADAKSIVSILTLGAAQGAVITLNASGADAREALAALSSLVESNFSQ